VHVYSAGGSVSLVSLSFSPIGSTWTPAPEGRAPLSAIVSTAHQNMCVDRDVASGKVQIWSCLGNAQQTWTLDSYGQLSTAGVCAEIPSGQTANMTLVDAASCSGGSNQKWRQGNFGALINLASGRCLDIPSANFTNGQQLQVYDCVGTANQGWVGPNYVPASGRISWNTSSSCLDRDVATGKVQIWSCNGLVNQTWTFNGNGTLTSGNSCMQLTSGSYANGGLVSAATCLYNAPNQQWSRGPSGSLRNIAAGRCIDLDSGNLTNGRQLIVWDCVGGPNQTWAGPS
jgi:fructan beta-fructosidase